MQQQQNKQNKTWKQPNINKKNKNKTQKQQNKTHRNILTNKYPKQQKLIPNQQNAKKINIEKSKNRKTQNMKTLKT